MSGIRGAPGDEHPGLRTLRAILDDPAVRVDGESLFAPDDLIARWEIAPGELADIGLPPLCHYRLSLSADRPITDPKGNLRLTWLDARHQPVPAVRRDGTLISSGPTRFLLRDPLRALVDAVEYMGAAEDTDERLRRFAVVRARLLETTGQVVAPENLKSMVIYQATGLGIKARLDPDGYRFEPELLGDLPGAEEDDEGPQRTSLLNRSETNKLNQRIGEAEADGSFVPRPSYVLTANTYVVLDPGVRAALGVVRRVNRANKETRQAFFDDKMSFLLPALREAGSDGSVVEFSDRVIGVMPWEHGTNLGGGEGREEWFPSADATTYVVKGAGGREVHLAGAGISEHVEAIKAAISEGRNSVEIGGRVVEIDETMLDDLNRIPVIEQPSPKAPTPKKPGTPKSYFYVKPKANDQDLTFAEGLGAKRPADVAAELLLKNAPKTYQMEGIDWLQRGYVSGMRGMLVADDMGLGKTFQVLAFLRWLKLHFDRSGASPGEPRFMVVAPKSLLGTWLEEVDIHLPDEGLGRPAKLYGDNLKGFRKAKGRDILTGTETLDREAFKGFDWILTTYETLRDYQISFALMPFEVIVFDEAQKIKENGAMVTEAARSQKAASLRLLMTGTPVENSLMDLWTLMDVMWPGRVGYTGRQFRAKFVNADAPDTAVLKRLLTEPQREGDVVVPQIMLRRMKEDVADLKPKHFRTVVTPMPSVQADAYRDACRRQNERPEAALVALQAIRNVSLHPDLEAAIDYARPASVADFIAKSARFVALFDILDRVRANDEKALVFVDLRRAQSVVAELIKHRYGLPLLPHVINGETNADQRTAIRQGFQKRKGFEVLLLAPRAAGFGLTLHSANHVVHLNRWWNPAVEDQCTDRAYRIGQNREVFVWIPIARHPDYADVSYDVILNDRLETKRTRAKDIIVPVRFDARELAGLHTEIFGRNDLEEELARMDWHRFEDWACDRIRGAGLSVNKTPRVGDGGADIVVRLAPGSPKGGFVQVKHRSRGKAGLVSEAEVFDVLRARDRYPISDPSFFLVTNGSIDERGLNAAKANGVRVIDYASVGKLASVVKQAFAVR